MSVGLQRLRDEPDAIRQGAIDKGEDPALVDRALELDARASATARRGRGAQGRAERGLEADRRGDQGRRGARRPRGRRACKAASSGRRRADPGASTPSSPRPRRPSTTSSSGSPTRPTRTSRSVARRPTSPSATWGEQLPREQPLDGEVGADAPAGGATWTPQAALGARRGARTSSTTPAARRSPAPASRSTRAPAPRSSAA